MAGPGTLILSIDCEGLWGFSDNADRYHGVITDESLTWAYRQVLDLLDEEEFPATFAFVSLFVSDPDEMRAETRRLSENVTHREWLAAARRAIARGELSGWSRPRALTEVLAHRQHEVASHSHTHLPVLEVADPHTAARVEMDSVVAWARLHDLPLQTYIFPRNQVVADWPLDSPIIGFRDMHNAPTRVGRVLGEFNVRTPSQRHPVNTKTPLPIPGGHICNVRTGPRRAIPISVTRARWRSISRHAAATGGVAHLWLHPHNLIYGHKQINLLRAMIRDTRAMRRSGDLLVQTQRDYVLHHTSAATLGGGP